LATQSKGREIYRDLRGSRQLMKGLGYCVLDDILELEDEDLEFRVVKGVRFRVQHLGTQIPLSALNTESPHRDGGVQFEERA
jgi:hypothetical protein